MSVELAFQDFVFDVVDREGVPWLKGTQIAKALGYTREDEISRLYRRYADEFTDSMTQVIGITLEHQNGVLGRVRIFSPRGS